MEERAGKVNTHDWVDQYCHLSVYRRDKRKAGGVHAHDFFSIDVVFSGTGTHVRNGVRCPMAAGYCAVVTPLDMHCYDELNDVDLLTINFDEEMFRGRMLQNFLGLHNAGGIMLPPDELATVEFYAGQMAAECRSRREFCVDYLRDLLECVIFILLRRAGGAMPEQAADPAMRKALYYLSLHFRENPSIEDLAKLAGLTPNYFSKLFRDATGSSYVDYRTGLKVDYAMLLLRVSSELLVEDVCFYSGFGSMTNFNRVFRQRVGVSPSKYREQSRQGAAQ